MVDYSTSFTSSFTFNHIPIVCLSLNDIISLKLVIVIPELVVYAVMSG